MPAISQPEESPAVNAPKKRTSLKERDPLDVWSKVLVPILLAIVAGIYTLQKDLSDRRTLTAQRIAETERQQLDRDTGYIKLLTSTNDRERNLGLSIIEVLKKENKFSADLVPVVQAVATGRPGDSNTQKAQDILASVAGQNPSKTNNSPATAKPSVVDQSATDVYIQIGSEEQRDDAELLRTELKKAGYPAPAVELVPNGTDHTYVRYFSVGNRGKADSINEAMKKLGFLSSVQNFATGRQLPQLEVWIGASEKTSIARERQSKP